MAKSVRNTRAQWVKRIHAAYGETVLAYLQLGRALLAAKKSLAHGDFLEMIERDLPFTATTAQRLMKIARDPRIAKAAHVQLLPLAWGTAYELTKMDTATFNEAMSAGDIKPDMTRADARRYVHVGVTHTKRTIVAPYYTSVPTREPPRLVTVYSSPDAEEEESPPSKPLPPSLRPDAVEVEPLVLVELAEKYERLNSDLFMNMQQHGGIAAGSALQVRFKAAAAKLLSIIEQN